MRQGLLLVLLILSAPAVTSAQPFNFSVNHHHLFGSCHGTLVIGDDGVRYDTASTKDQRDWKYEDIQQVQLLSPKNLAVVTYEDRKLKVGGDKNFKFEIIDGELSNQVYRYLLQKAGKPIVTKLAFLETKVDYQIPAKHLHTLGGCQGILRVTPVGITYQTDSREESRTWLFADIESLGPMDPFHLRITAHENSHFHYRGRKDFNFVLKQKLDEKTYEHLWDRIYKIGLESKNTGN